MGFVSLPNGLHEESQTSNQLENFRTKVTSLHLRKYCWPSWHYNPENHVRKVEVVFVFNALEMKITNFRLIDLHVIHEGHCDDPLFIIMFPSTVCSWNSSVLCNASICCKRRTIPNLGNSNVDQRVFGQRGKGHVIQIPEMQAFLVISRLCSKNNMLHQLHVSPERHRCRTDTARVRSGVWEVCTSCSHLRQKTRFQTQWPFALYKWMLWAVAWAMGSAFAYTQSHPYTKRGE